MYVDFYYVYLLLFFIFYKSKFPLCYFTCIHIPYYYSSILYIISRLEPPEIACDCCVLGV